MDISINNLGNGQTTNKTNKANTQNPTGLVQRYMTWCDGQMKYRIAWFLFPALILPCLFMPLAIYAMLMNGGIGFPIYLFVAMMGLLGGMVANIGEKNTRMTISIFFATALWNVVYPMVAILMF